MALFVVLVAVLGVFTFDVVAEMPTDLQIDDLSAGRPCTKPTENGDWIYVHYTGRSHPDIGGRVFESTQHKKPILFQIGKGTVIRAFDISMLNLCPGARRRITVPPSYGYDAESRPEKVGADDTLMFDLELIHIDRENYMTKLKPACWFAFCFVMGGVAWNYIRVNTLDTPALKKLEVKKK